ncbi:MAG: hypothetical protein N2D54_02435 [Chloroflexota bacterium]
MKITTMAGFIMLGLMVLFVACSPQSDGEPNTPDDGIIIAPVPNNDATEEPPVNRGNVVPGNAEVKNVDILILESYPIQVMLKIEGSLPTPCHVLAAKFSDPNAQNEIYVEIFSEIAEDVICIQVIEDFQENVGLPLNDLPDGKYSIWVNGENVGEFTYPGG